MQYKSLHFHLDYNRIHILKPTGHRECLIRCWKRWSLILYRAEIRLTPILYHECMISKLGYFSLYHWYMSALLYYSRIHNCNCKRFDYAESNQNPYTGNPNQTQYQVWAMVWVSSTGFGRKCDRTFPFKGHFRQDIKLLSNPFPSFQSNQSHLQQKLSAFVCSKK